MKIRSQHEEKLGAVGARRPSNERGVCQMIRLGARFREAIWLFPVLILASVAFLVSCSRQPAADPGAEKLPENVLAVVGNHRITVAEFEAELNRRAESSGERFETPQQKKALLEEMIRFKALLAQAKRAGMDKDPKLVAAYNRMIVGKFQEDELKQRKVEEVDVTDAEVQAYYDSHPEKFATPAQLRVGIIFRRASPKATPEKREGLRQVAAALRAKAIQLDAEGFRRLAIQHSDDQASRYAGGDSGWFDVDRPGSRFDARVVEAALKLNKAGEIAPLVETPQGFYIVRLLDRRPPGQRPLSAIHDGIMYQLRQKKRAELREAFFREMESGLAIQINEHALNSATTATVQAELTPPPQLPK